MASHTHFMLDALVYLADPDRSPQPATDERPGVATRVKHADDPRPERRRGRSRHLVTLLAAARATRPGSAA
jgi:hypothetical protein